jgi:hypothetical protein
MAVRPVRPVPASDPVVELLRELVDLQRKTLAAIEQSRRPLHDKPITNLLPVLAAAVVDKAFSAREVMQHAALVDDSLRDALAAAGLSNARQLGRWLRSVENQTIAGVVLTRIGLDRDGVVWRVSRV